MDLLDRLMDEQPEEDDSRARRREVVVAEELVLPRAGLVDLQVAGEAVGLLHRHAVLELEALRLETSRLHVRPLRQAVPDRREPRPSAGSSLVSTSTFSGREKAT